MKGLAMPDDLVLYTNPRSRGAMARWMMEELGQPCRTEPMGYGPPMRTPEFLALNPMGKVPVLTHGPRVITEVAAICAYLAGAFPAARLGPETPDESARFWRWIFFAAGPVEAAITHRAMGFVVPADKRGLAGYGTPDLAIDTLEGAVGQSDWIAGDRFTAADVHVGSHVTWGLMFGTFPDRPAFTAYRDRLVARPAWQGAAQMDAADLERMQAEAAP
jgi:glutathione S-transferase